MMFSPDLSQWYFNKMLGLGDMEHNRRLREERERKRPIVTDVGKEIALWNIWVYYQKDILRRLQQKASEEKGQASAGEDDD
jgi:type IV secretion system protein VirD4